MKDKEASMILLELIKKYKLGTREKDAILTAVGILGWSSLAEGRLKRLKERRKKIAE